MSKPVSEQLFRLVKSLSKSEKRQFKLLSKRTSPEETKKFVSLFDAVDSLITYDEQLLRRKVPQIPESQIPNMKAHLYEQILRSLRMVSSKKNQSQQILLYLENAGMLYNKCLYSDALNLLDKAKLKAIQSDNTTILPAILELEKNAMRQAMSQNIDARSEQLIQRDTRLGQNDSDDQRLLESCLETEFVLSETRVSFAAKKIFKKQNGTLKKICPLTMNQS
jgi:hypothetical protein